VAGGSRRRPGELEAATLRILWDAGRPVSARQVLEAFGTDAPGLTAMLTVLDRLVVKGQVRRVPTDRGVSFEPVVAESAVVAERMLQALVGSRDRSAALLRFAGELDARDVDLLRAAIEPPSAG